MIHAWDPFRQLDFLSVILRLSLSMLFGGLIGLEGGRKGRAAGFRTCMLVCLGAALTILLGQYELQILTDPQPRVDVCRFGAQVINGVGFLGAGTILVTRKHQVKGVTTAAGLWASACIGLAIGAGFYEGVVLAFTLVFFILRVLPHLESQISNHMGNMNVYVEYDAIEHTGAILKCIRSLNVHILDVEIQHGTLEEPSVSAILTIHLKRAVTHNRVLASISQLECIFSVEEI